MTLINIGFGNMVSAQRVIAMVSPESAPIKRMIQDVRDKGLLIDGILRQKHEGCAYNGQRKRYPVRAHAGGSGSANVKQE